MIQRMPCPICDRPLPVEVTGDSSFFPFCSLRCKQVDLGRWLAGDYAVVDELTPEKLIEQLNNDSAESEPLD